MLGSIARKVFGSANDRFIKKQLKTVQKINSYEPEIQNLTDEEQKMYAEYAAGVLMKYNAGSNNRVLKGQKLIQVEAKEEAQAQQAARREQLAAEYEANKKDKENTKKNK